VEMEQEQEQEIEIDEIVPKIEEIDEDELEDAKPPLPSPPEEDLDAKEEHAVTKRPRGRPRKHPREPLTISTKPLKGRSKTGCITCRRRKKKCDETKPACKAFYRAARHRALTYLFNVNVLIVHEQACIARRTMCTAKDIRQRITGRAGSSGPSKVRQMPCRVLQTLT
jgi:hypothetical protein